jgi:membrane fusion protein, multidrug efflux system
LSGDVEVTRRRWWMAVGAVQLLLLCLAFWAGTQATTSAALAARQRSAPATVLTVPVVRRDLTETLYVSGGQIKLGASYGLSLSPVTLPGTVPLVTAPPPKPGAQLRDGSIVAQIAGRPIFVMTGSTPMYRDLTVGDSGADVLQLQQGLEALGFAISDPAGVFEAGTERAVRELFQRDGYSPPSGVTAASSTIPASSGGASGGKTAAGDPPLVLPQSEIVFVPTLPQVVESDPLVVGQPLPSTQILLSSGRLRAVLPLTTGQQAVVTRGNSVTISILPADGGPAIQIKSQVRTVGSSAAISLPASAPVSAGQRFAASIVIANSGGPVLAVPESALFTLPDGSTAVTVVRAGHRWTVRVSAGNPIGGYIPIEPADNSVTAGTEVLVGE